MKDVVVTLPEYMNEKSAIVKVYSASCVHVAWKIRDGKILVFEDLPECVPRTRVCVFENVHEYIDAIYGVEWIMVELFEKNRVKVLDNGGQTFDRYTVVIGDDVYSMSKDPLYPQGFNQYVGTIGEIDLKQRGRETYYDELPEEVIKAILLRILECE